MKLKRLTLDACLTALALALFIVELQLPPLLPPLPGIKLGLANIVTLFSIFTLRKSDAAAIQYLRIVLGCLFASRISALAYSLAGGTLCLAVMILAERFLSRKQIWAAGVLGALAHNAGQLAVAVFALGSEAIGAYYVPVLGLAGIVCGLFTGWVARFTVGPLARLISKYGL